MGHTTTTTTTTKTKKSPNDIQEKKRKRIVGHYFGLWARCLNDEFQKKICNNCHVASSGLVGKKNSHLSRSAEADTTCGELGRRETLSDTHAHTLANLRLRGSVVVTVAAAVLLQLRANTHTHKHRRADSSRPLER